MIRFSSIGALFLLRLWSCKGSVSDELDHPKVHKAGGYGNKIIIGGRVLASPHKKPAEPTKKPSNSPALVAPNKLPTYSPSEMPISTEEPTGPPTKKLTTSPTEELTASPKKPTKVPTYSPTEIPISTEEPTGPPTEKPTTSTTKKLTTSPTKKLTGPPTKKPTTSPTEEPTGSPKKLTNKPMPTDVPRSNCKDIDNFIFIRKIGTLKILYNCEWLLRQKSIRSLCNDIEIRNGCKKTCKHCGNEE